MDKLHELAFYIIQYGYLAVFLLVFLQELGVPNPITNELVLMFGGYLSFTHALNLYKVIAVAVVADFTGTCILYFVFYIFGKWLLKRERGWFPLKHETIYKLESYVNREGQWSIYLGRLTPFLRGYVSIAAGLLHIKPSKFLTTVFLSAVTWSGGLVLLGRLLAPYWSTVMKELDLFEIIAILALLAVGIIFAGRYFSRRQVAVK
jgi:membrane protein DedA with SNARE-associated domain